MPDNVNSTDCSVVFTDAGSLADTALSALEALRVPITLYDYTSSEHLLSRLQDANIVITNKTVLDAETLQQLPALRYICVAATGVNNIDVKAAQRLGIQVSNVQNYAGLAVAQHVFALLLQLTNQVQHYHQAVQQGNWSRSKQFCLLDYPITELAGKTMVIVGFGTLGKTTAKLAEAFGMHVVVAERPDYQTCRPGRLPFFQALAQADVISLHCPLTDATIQLFDDKVLSTIKPGALLINTARGALIDETALLQALQSGQLAGAALDVLSSEPPPADNLLLNAQLPNLIITPHVAWASAEARLRLVEQLADNITAFINGSPKRLVSS